MEEECCRARLVLLMTSLLALLAMLLAHVIDDFGLQHFTHLNELKTKTWWIEQCYLAKKYNNIDTSIYKNDYIVCLVLHAFKWSCMTLLPGILILGFPQTWLLASLVCANTIVHAYIDDMKANKLKINLVQDQLMHLAQIIVTFLCLV